MFLLKNILLSNLGQNDLIYDIVCDMYVYFSIVDTSQDICQKLHAILCKVPLC